ncbi:DUF1697 domain-containing protein [Mesorhizobium sp. ASY16-5R]|uniref:DUF1697 domain-containing protein n=1 Tax=Mesorhizobium sp. ASY16-5R TaxID=3445772 RepID=UPI003FA09D23
MHKTVFILLFRGVGGATQLPTGPLRQALTAAGFENVATYINSGNAILRTGMAREKMIAKVAAIASREFGFEKKIHAPTLDEWSELIARNPFPDAASVPKFLHAAVLEKVPEDKNVEAIRAYAKEGERIEIVGKVAYLHTPVGFGTSKMAERFDKLIGVDNTARNWNSVLKLESLAKKAASG